MAARRFDGSIGMRTVALACALALLAGQPAAAYAVTKNPPVTVPSATLVTMSGQQLWSKSRETERHVASCIKMLNALVARDRAKLDDVVTIPAKSARTEDGVGLVRGQKVTVRKLLQLTMVASSNDAASALAIHIAGSEKAYVALMNKKAAEIGLTHTRAVDPHGLSKREISSARDLSVTARKVMADPFLRKTVLMESVVLTRPARKPKRLKATNEMLGHYRGIEGVKTGFTYAAGYCFVGAAKRGNLELVGVVLKAKSKNARFSQMRKLLDWGFERYRWRRVVSTTTTMGAAAITSGTVPSVTVHAAKEASRAIIATGYPITKESILPTVAAPIRRGDQLGVVKVWQDGKLLATVALLADSDVATAAAPPPPPAPAEAPAPALSIRDRLGGLSRRVLVALASTI
ncbi:MAG: D-alanyl-D-alanine carboxypeptidase [Coriobacteriia bacterium]|nr:D-alanyl-D-alanine carboxypeptidase [Coriobacteriia bacterium]